MSGDRLLVLTLPEGTQALALDLETEELSHDDSVENGDTDTVCKAKIDYSRDATGNVQAIRTETRCSENKKPLPAVRRRSFRWNAAALRFDELKPTTP